MPGIGIGIRIGRPYSRETSLVSDIKVISQFVDTKIYLLFKTLKITGNKVQMAGIANNFEL